jgi:nucleotide-binding universal stress UspA family protein
MRWPDPAARRGTAGPPSGDPDGDGQDRTRAALAAGADGLAMGAYGSGRMIEWILCGVTEHVLQHATLPLLPKH